MGKYGIRKTKKPIEIKLSEKRKGELDNLIEGWDFETKIFIENILQSYVDKPDCLWLRWSRKLAKRKDGKFEMLNNPNKLRDRQKRFIATGKTKAKDAYGEILKKELSFEDVVYLLDKIKHGVENVILPEELIELFDAIHSVHLKGEGNFGKKAPKKPFLLFVGQTGSGKTETIKGLIERVIFSDEVLIKTDYKQECERIVEKHPFLTSIPFLQLIKPIEELEKLKHEEGARKKLERYRFMVKRGICRKYFGKKIEQLKKREEKSGHHLDKDGSIEVDYQAISADKVQTSGWGETGRNLVKEMSSEDMPGINHVLEAHGLLCAPDHRHQKDVQTDTLMSAVNRIMDEISSGERECFFIADTHSPERIASDTYRRFDEQGVIIDVSEYWKNKKYLAQLIELELSLHNMSIDKDYLKQITDRIYEIFSNKSLVITPAYVRKLISSIIEQKGNIKAEYFHDEILVRKCFKNVARNSHGDLYKAMVKNPKKEYGYSWDDYEGKVKDDFLEAISSTLFRGGDNKGIVLVGPPGSGKTFLTQVVGATHPEITYISASLDDLYREGHAEQGMIKNLDGMYNIAKMLAPSIIVINEADAMAKKRNTTQSDPADRITNKFLDILDGDESVKGTFTVMTTNLGENLDLALTRPGRLEIMSIDGKLSENESLNIIERSLEDEPLDKEIGLRVIYATAKHINNTPAGYVDFIRKLKGLRKTDFSVICEYKKLYESGCKKEKLDEFIKFNSKAIIRVMEAVETDPQIIVRVKKDVGILFGDKGLFYNLIKGIEKTEDYPLKKSHLVNAKMDLLKNPQKKAFREFDDFVSGELSSEPQVGKIVGAAYGNNVGMIIPINTTLVPRSKDGDNIIVTGATKGSVLQESDPAEMTIQSAQESLALNLHYFETLFNKRNVPIDPTTVIGRFLEERAIHHQFETVSYTGGGPSAGFALAINTLSVLLDIPVYHDFGITGAPGIRGTSSEKAGSSVMIGGEDKKADRVLKDLDRMFVPKKNYSTIPVEHQESYWNDRKIIVPVKDYSDVIPEVLYVKHEDHISQLRKLNNLRIVCNKKAILLPEDELRKEKGQVLVLEQQIRKTVEEIIIQRLVALYDFYCDPRNNKFANLKHIFANCSF